MTVYGPKDETTKQKFMDGPLRQQLEAVQQDDVYKVYDELWMLGIGYTAADSFIGDLTEHRVQE